MDRPIKKGDTVVLKSGGPIMTVEKTGSYSKLYGIEDGALCVWFDSNREPKKKVFDVNSLKIFDSQECEGFEAG